METEKPITAGLGRLQVGEIIIRVGGDIACSHRRIGADLQPVGVGVGGVGKNAVIFPLALSGDLEAPRGEEVVAPEGTAWDNGSATLEASTIAARFWESYQARGPLSANVG